MGDTESEEYLTDVAYLRHFCVDLSPALLRLVAALNGFTPPPAEDFDYCEIGSGTGDTTATLAAAYPRARFVGVDINPEHVAFADKLAKSGGLENVRFLERDLEDLGRDDLPQFDFIGAHGVLSWIAPAKRRALIELAAAKLKPGGLLYVSYNALPGWAAIEPLRRLMLDASAGIEGNSLERARHGLAVAKALADAGAGYFANNPAAASMLTKMVETGLPYVAHEYFHAHWHPMYFADVAREMAASRLHYIGDLPVHSNYRDLTVSPSIAALMKENGDRLAFESLKDYAANEFFRRDIYVLGAAARSEETTRNYLDTTPFGTMTSADAVQREIRLAHCTLRFTGPVFDALIPILAGGAATLLELEKNPALAAFGSKRIRDAILHLVIGEQATPMQSSALSGEAAAFAGFRIASAYNRKRIEQRLASKQPMVLASPVAGTGVTLPMLHAVFLHLLTAVPPTEREAWIGSFVAKQSLNLHVAGRPVVGAADQTKVIAAEFEGFYDKRVPKLVELGILEKIS